jgi:hypothetical protein
MNGAGKAFIFRYLQNLIIQIDEKIGIFFYNCFLHNSFVWAEKKECAIP